MLQYDKPIGACVPGGPSMDKVLEDCQITKAPVQLFRLSKASTRRLDGRGMTCVGHSISRVDVLIIRGQRTAE